MGENIFMLKLDFFPLTKYAEDKEWRFLQFPLRDYAAAIKMI